ncbi:MAG: DUF2029 domain-containing protein [Acidimicrobiia bacterium]|nr:DUF2029 domain-containing protein [Acidimicrobiia bacterium]
MDGQVSAKFSSGLLLTAVAGVEAVWLIGRGRFDGPFLWVLLAAAIGAHAGLVVREHRRPTLGLRPILTATFLVGVVAVVLPPFASRDVFLYGLYGRMVEHYHANPYLHVPRSFGHDPLLHASSKTWWSTRSVYGPLFTAISAVGATLYGSSAWAARTWFQVLDLLSLLGIVVVLARRSASSATLIAVGLGPPLLAVVNNGHNDLLVGFLALVGVVLALDHRPALSGVALGAACLIKVLALPLAAGAVLCFVAARRWRDAAISAATLAGVVGVGYLLAGGQNAVAPLGQNSSLISSLSIWRLVRPVARAIGDRDFGAGAAGRADVVQLAFVVAVVAAGLYWFRNRSTMDRVALIVAPLVLLLLLSAYDLPAYAAMVLPAAALVSGLRLRLVAFAQATVYLLAYVRPLGPVHRIPLPPFVPAVRLAVPWMCLALAVALLSSSVATRKTKGP